MEFQIRAPYCFLSFIDLFCHSFQLSFNALSHFLYSRDFEYTYQVKSHLNANKYYRIICCFVSGDPISCINDDGIPRHVINTFCWITYTFTLPGQTGQVGTHVAHPGVANDLVPGTEKRYHAYYQWVPFMLFFQVYISN